MEMTQAMDEIIDERDDQGEQEQAEQDDDAPREQELYRLAEPTADRNRIFRCERTDRAAGIDRLCFERPLATRSRYVLRKRPTPIRRDRRKECQHFTRPLE